MAEPRHLVKNITCKGCGKREAAVSASSGPKPGAGALLLLVALSEPHWTASEWGTWTVSRLVGSSCSPRPDLEGLLTTQSTWKVPQHPPRPPAGADPGPQGIGSEGLLTLPPFWLCWALGLHRFTLSGRSVQPEFPL